MFEIALFDIFYFLDIWKNLQDKVFWDKLMLATVSASTIDELAYSNGIRIQQIINIEFSRGKKDV